MRTYSEPDLELRHQGFDWLRLVDWRRSAVDSILLRRLSRFGADVTGVGTGIDSVEGVVLPLNL